MLEPRRILTRFTIALGAGSGLLIAAAIAALGPWSPLCMAQADALMGWRRPALALTLYEEVARRGATTALQAEARYRAGWIAAVELGDPQRAVRHLRWHLRLDGEHQIDARLQLARLHARELDAPLRAARLYAAAAERGEGDERAGDWLLRAAEIYESEGRSARADVLRRQVIDGHPTRATQARLQLARSLMDRGRFARAYEHYQHVVAQRDGVAGAERALAKLGLSICLESQGQLEAALAELEGAEIPEEILRDRLEQISERSMERALQ